MLKKYLLVLLLVAFASDAWATTFYVDKAGSNGNSCATAQSATPANAKLTIAAGMACLASSDTLIVRAGTYVESLVDPTVAAGTSGAYTTIQRNGSDVVKIQPSSGQFALGMASANYHHIKFDGIWFDGSNCSSCSHVIMLTWGGAGPSNATHDLLFTNVTVTSIDNSSTSKNCVNVTGAGNGIVFSGGEVFNCIYAFYWATPGGAGEGSGGIIERMYIHDIFDFGIHVYSDFGGINDIVVQDNYIYNTARRASCSGAVILSGGARHIARRNVVNKVRGSCGSGIIIHYGATAAKVYKNSVYDAQLDGIEISAGGSSVLVHDNISLGSGGQNLNDLVGATKSHNITSGTATNFWVDPVNGNFSLLSTAATAIDAGLTPIGGTAVAFNGSAPEIGVTERFTASSAEVGEVADDKVVVNLGMNLNQPVQITNATGWTTTCGTISSVAVTANAQLTFTLVAPYGGGGNCAITYVETTGNAKDSALIGGLINQRLSGFTSFAVTDNTGGAPAGSVHLSHWRVYLLYGAADTDWVAKCAEDSTNCFVAPGSKIWVRGKLRNNSGSDYATFNLSNRWRYNVGSYVALTGSYVNGIKVLGTGGQLSTMVADGAALTADVLTSNETTNVAGLAVRSASSIPSVTLVDSSEIEFAQAIDISPSAVIGDVYELCPHRDDGTALTCATPIKITIGSFRGTR